MDFHLKKSSFNTDLRGRIGDREVPGYFANGNGGQLIFVVPSASMVVVFTGGRYNEGFLPGALNSMERILTAARL